MIQYVDATTNQPIVNSSVCTSRYVYIVYEERCWRLGENGEFGEIAHNNIATLESLPDSYKVADKVWFPEHLHLLGIKIEENKCTCESHKLAYQGCTCGAFQRELEREGKYD